MTTRKKLCNIKGISEAKVDKIKVNILAEFQKLTSPILQEATGKLIVS